MVKALRFYHEHRWKIDAAKRAELRIEQTIEQMNLEKLCHSLNETQT
jgi:hypothetical protein